jgi:hypothetical protein
MSGKMMAEDERELAKPAAQRPGTPVTLGQRNSARRPSGRRWLKWKFDPGVSNRLVKASDG